MQMQGNSRNPDDTLVATFRMDAIKNEAKTLAEGRPIYDDVEVVQIRMPGNRTGAPVFLAHELSTQWEIDPISGEQRQMTYAERFRRQYLQFKAQQQQTKSGTPLDHAPFLTEARRSELRALNVYTVEQLAAIDGAELKNLGPGGREMKNRAEELIAEAKTGAPSVQLLAELEALRSQNAVLQEDNEALKRTGGEGPFKDMTEEQIRAYIATNTGQAPIGNLNRKTLVRMAMDARPNKAA